MPHTLIFRLLMAAAVMTTCGVARAQRNAKGPAYTEPPADDPNFPLQGEFVGPISVGEGEYRPLGLQIRPVGGDNFEAVSFMGGLPGEKKHKPEPVKMIGRRSGDFVVLSGGPWAVFAEADHCLLVDREGNKIGRLDRVQRSSPTMGALPPKGAVVLFDGSGVDQFTNAQMTKEGLLMEGADLKPMFQDFDLHVEFRLPYMPQASGQSRGNSGLYLQSRYECQVLDSFGQDRMINGLGALYQFRKPDVNMCFPPLVWQTYDIRFTAPRWAADGSKIRNAHVTSWINGVKVQDNVSLPNKTGAGKQEEPLLLPTKIQNHGDPVRFRNIWLVDRGLTPAANFPVMSPVESATSEPKSDQKPKAQAKKKDEPKAEKKDQPKSEKKSDAQADKKAKAKSDAASSEPSETDEADAEQTASSASNGDADAQPKAADKSAA